MAALVGLIDLTKVQSFSEGPSVSGSSLLSGGGKGCRFRGRICTAISALSKRLIKDKLTPGSVTDACMKEETQI